MPGGKGEPTDTLGGINGWLVTKGAPKEATDFLKFFISKDVQTRLAGGNFIVPVVKGGEAGLSSAFMKQIADNLAKSKYHQNFYDQSLGPSVGRVVNDVTAEIAGGSMTPQAGRDRDPGRLEAGQLTLPGPAQAADSRSIGSATSPGWAMSLRGANGDGRLTALVLFLPPALLLFTLFVVLPIGEAAWYSGFNWNGFGRPTNWVGFDNYRFVFETRAFWLALRNNVLIIVVSLVIQLPLALALALVLAEKFRGAVALRMLFFLPYILAEIATGLIFSFVYDGDYGLRRLDLAPVRRRGAASAREHRRRRCWPS